MKNLANPKAHYTHLASEFYVLSMLNRMQIECYLTLGNNKSVDILVRNGKKNISIDVKGARNGEWLMGGKPPVALKDHYYALVHYQGKIDHPEYLPLVYIIPSGEIEKLLVEGGKGHGIKFNPVNRDKMRKYLHNWSAFIDG